LGTLALKDHAITLTKFHLNIGEI